MSANTQSAESPDQAGPLRSVWFVAAAIALFALDLALVHADYGTSREVRASLSRARDSSAGLDVESMARRDPALGSAIPVTRATLGLRSRIGRSSRGGLVVMLSDCTSCTGRGTERLSADARRLGLPLIAVRSVQPAGSGRADAPSGSGPVLGDPGGRLHRHLNSWWSGRAYYFDRMCRLRWVMSFEDADRALPHIPALCNVLSSAANRPRERARSKGR